MPKKLHLIKEVLEEKERSGYWLAKETEISYNSIHGYVNGKIEPSLTNLFRIAEALKVDPKDLINNEASPSLKTLEKGVGKLFKNRKERKKSGQSD